MTQDSQESHMAVIGPSESDYEYAPSKMNYDGSHAPYGYAGFIVGECTVVCVECHDPAEDSTDSPIFGNTEADFPGLYCEDCGRHLDTDLLVYRNGPGSELWEELDDTYKI